MFERNTIHFWSGFPERQGDDLVRLAIDILSRRSVPPAVFVRHQIITAENVDRIYPNDRLISWSACERTRPGHRRSARRGIYQRQP
jgi:hypothetical protein